MSNEAEAVKEAEDVTRAIDAVQGAMAGVGGWGKSSWEERDAKREAREEADRVDFAKRCEEGRTHNAASLKVHQDWAAQAKLESEVRISVMPREVAALERIALALEVLTGKR